MNLILARFLINFTDMKIPIQYLNDEDGNVKAVQIPVDDWEKVLEKLKSYEQALRIRKALEESLKQAKVLSTLKGHKQTLTEFLNEV